MFLWALQIMIEPLVYIGLLYLLFVFVKKRDVAMKLKVATHVTLPKDTLAAAQARANRENRTFSNMLAVILDDWLTEHGDLPVKAAVQG